MGKVSIFVFIFMILGGIAWSVFGITVLQNEKAGLNWTSVEGKILRSKVKETSDAPLEGLSTKAYRPHIVYQYTVDGILYSSSKFSLEQEKSYKRQDINEIINHYPAGLNLTVYYDPDDPNTSILKLEPIGAGHKKILEGIVFIIITVLLLYFRYSHRLSKIRETSPG